MHMCDPQGGTYPVFMDTIETKPAPVYIEASLSPNVRIDSKCILTFEVRGSWQNFDRIVYLGDRTPSAGEEDGRGKQSIYWKLQFYGIDLDSSTRPVKATIDEIVRIDATSPAPIVNGIATMELRFKTTRKALFGNITTSLAMHIQFYTSREMLNTARCVVAFKTNSSNSKQKSVISNLPSHSQHQPIPVIIKTEKMSFESTPTTTTTTTATPHSTHIPTIQTPSFGMPSPFSTLGYPTHQPPPLPPSPHNNSSSSNNGVFSNVLYPPTTPMYSTGGTMYTTSSHHTSSETPSGDFQQQVFFKPDPYPLSPMTPTTPTLPTSPATGFNLTPASPQFAFPASPQFFVQSPSAEPPVISDEGEQPPPIIQLPVQRSEICNEMFPLRL